MSIRARNVLRADAACVSADVLTPAERFVEREQRRRLPKPALVNVQPVDKPRVLKWGEVPAIRAVLLDVLIRRSSSAGRAPAL